MGVFIGNLIEKHPGRAVIRSLFVGVTLLQKIASLRLPKGYIQACYSAAGLVFIDKAKKK